MFEIGTDSEGQQYLVDCTTGIVKEMTAETLHKLRKIVEPSRDAAGGSKARGEGAGDPVNWGDLGDLEYEILDLKGVLEDAGPDVDRIAVAQKLASMETKFAIKRVHQNPKIRMR